MSEPKPFIDYWNEIDEAMQRLYGIDTNDAGIEPDDIANSQDAGWTAEEYALWHGQKYDLTKKDDYNPNTPKSQAIIRWMKGFGDAPRA